ncbi:alpha/beta hydrolase [Acidovorax sp. SRB_24]|uniref:PHA/PHB synthase family protein n=1 Tax=Acidovorax sp. SRB_24 TaxID=1962700 RepID=UPI00145F84D7|nr:alpha/beta fold hydrolase [Acidovorax sp. SRB_24]NMM77590.1 poly-beta-hydroxybutyrate polymerase [Acidovorax sp. SRB_24]
MAQPSDPSPAPPGRRAAHAAETPTEKLDRLVHAGGAEFTGGLSPVSLALAAADWAWHLGVSPGRQLQLAALAARLWADTLHAHGRAPEADGVPDEDPRFRHDAWAHWPYSQMRAGFHNAEAFWREASWAPGMTAHHTDLTRFFARQWLDMLAPANWPATNPLVLRDALESGGTRLRQGARHWLADASGVPLPGEPERIPAFQVGRDVAVTPGAVVYRNPLIELIRYAPQTPTVHPEPVLIVPSWIMKYYILDLSPHNSLVRYLVGRGHTVYMLSWRNPDAADSDLSMDDYLRLGVLDALQAVATQGDRKTPVHAVGYCLGGTLLAIAAAAMARAGGVAEQHLLSPLKTLTLLAAQTDFSDPGELGLFIDEGQIDLLDHITRSQGYLSGKQMAGSFQFLHSRDLVWARRMREYLLGERDQSNDLMAWNADTTRMPARMHHEYLTELYLHNALATHNYCAEGQAVSLADLQPPMFLVGTQRDHVSPWRSVYKLHQLCDAEITFVLASGGHNAGIVSEPGHPHRSYQIHTRPARGRWTEPGAWAAKAPSHEGSWWPAWQAWLARHSSRRQATSPIAAGTVLCDAPGTYVLQRYKE